MAEAELVDRFRLGIEQSHDAVGATLVVAPCSSRATTRVAPTAVCTPIAFHMRNLMTAATIAVAAIVASHASAQTCLRPKWTECVSFPNGGRHTGMSPYGRPVEMAIPAAAEICVSTEWEIRAETYAQFTRNGMPWPDRDWEVDVDTFCFYKN